MRQRTRPCTDRQTPTMQGALSLQPTPHTLHPTPWHWRRRGEPAVAPRAPGSRAACASAPPTTWCAANVSGGGLRACVVVGGGELTA
jgi:hypothetical protein